MKLAQDPGGRATQSDRKAVLLEQVYSQNCGAGEGVYGRLVLLRLLRDPHGCTSGNLERQMGMKRETVRATRNLCLTPSTFNLTFSGPEEHPSIPTGTPMSFRLELDEKDHLEFKDGQAAVNSTCNCRLR